MQFTKIEVRMDYRHGYGDGAEPGVTAEVEFGYGRTIKLTDEQTLEVVKLAVSHALTHFTVDLDAISVIGKAGAPRPIREPVDDRIPVDADADTPL